MNNVIRLSILSIVVLFSLPIGSSPVEQTAAPGNDEYEVFSALINDLYVKDNVKLIVITNPTCCDTSRTDLQKGRYEEQLGPVSNETLEDYVARNKQSMALEKNFKLKTNYQIIPYVDVEELFRNVDLDDAWKVFYSEYPGSGGYIRFSRVGFNKAKDQALVSTAWMAGTRRGEGHYVLLTRQDGSWKVSKKVPTWVV